MQICGRVRDLVCGRGVVVFECSLLVIEIQACEFVGLAEFRFCQDFSRTFSSKETLSAVELHNHFRPPSKELQRCVRFPEERLELATM